MKRSFARYPLLALVLTLSAAGCGTDSEADLQAKQAAVAVVESFLGKFSGTWTDESVRDMSEVLTLEGRETLFGTSRGAGAGAPMASVTQEKWWGAADRATLSFFVRVTSLEKGRTSARVAASVLYYPSKAATTDRLPREKTLDLSLVRSSETEKWVINALTLKGDQDATAAVYAWQQWYGLMMMFAIVLMASTRSFWLPLLATINLLMPVYATSSDVLGAAVIALILLVIAYYGFSAKGRATRGLLIALVVLLGTGNAAYQSYLHFGPSAVIVMAIIIESTGILYAFLVRLGWFVLLAGTAAHLAFLLALLLIPSPRLSVAAALGTLMWALTLLLLALFRRRRHTYSGSFE